MATPCDIWMVSYQRKELTANAINYLHQRTKYPYRLFVIDNNSTDGTDKLLQEYERDGRVFLWLKLSRNVGIHMAHNIGLSLVDSDYCVSTDNDLYAPDLEPCWLTQLIKIMDKNKEYGAIACQPHAYLGRSDPEKTGKDVLEVDHCGAHLRLMRTEMVRKAGGWCRHFNANRNHEEKTIASHLSVVGSKVGYAANIRCYHDFGDDNNWGYKDIPPHTHGHRIPGKEIWPSPEKMKENEHLFDTKTWERK